MDIINSLIYLAHKVIKFYPQLLSKHFKAFGFILFSLIAAKQAIGETIQISFTQFDTYSPEVAHIEVGDTVVWLPTSEGHNVEFLAGPEMNNIPPKSVVNSSHSILFKKSGIYLYGCTPHLNIGMIGLVVVGNDLRNIKNIKEVELPRVAKSVLQKLIVDAQSYANSK